MKLPQAADLMQDVPAGSRPVIAPSAAAVTAIPRAQEGLGRAVQGLSQAMHQEQLKLDNVRAEDALNQAKLRAMELTIGDNGFSKVKGEHVLKRPIRKEYGERFSKAMEEIEKGLDNPNQVGLFRRRGQPVADRRQSAGGPDRFHGQSGDRCHGPRGGVGGLPSAPGPAQG